MNMHGSALAANLCLSLFKVEAKHKQPNTLRRSYEGFVSYNFSCGVILFKGTRGILLITCATVSTQSPQKIMGTLDW